MPGLSTMGVDVSGIGLPPLPKPGTDGVRGMAGPTPYSNWVIPGRLIAGAYPASMDDHETDRILSLLLGLGINTFVCLQAEVNIHVPEHAWRAGAGLRPYIKDAQHILSRAHEANSACITQRKIDFLHLPIIDGSVTTDTALSRLAYDCCDRVLRGEKLYIHCWGGHGRTGTLVATMLGLLYGLPCSAALRHTQAYHDCRMYPQGVRSPQTTVQRAQVRRLLSSPSILTGIAARIGSSNGGSSSNGPVSSSSGDGGSAIKNLAPSSNDGFNGSGSSSSNNAGREGTPSKAAAVLANPLTPVRPTASRANSVRSIGSSLAAAAAEQQQLQPLSWTPPSTRGALGYNAYTPGAAGSSSIRQVAAAVATAATTAAPAAACNTAVSSSTQQGADSALAALLKNGFAARTAPTGLQSRLAGTSAAVTTAAASTLASAGLMNSLLQGPRTPAPVRAINKGNSLVRRPLGLDRIAT